MPYPSFIIQLSDVLPALDMAGAPTDGGALLQTYINTAQDIVEDIVGNVIPRTFTEVHDGGDSMICVRHLPLLCDPYTHQMDPTAITSLTEVIGITSYNLTLQPVGQAVDNFGYSVDSVLDGIITRRSAGSQPFPFYRNQANITVTYTAGLTSVPYYIRQGTIELVKVWWEYGHQAYGPASSFMPTIKDDFEDSSGHAAPSWLVPDRVKEMLQPGLRMPVIS